MAKEPTFKIIRRAMIVGTGAFLLAFMVSFISTGLLDRLTSAIAAGTILMLIVLTGILFDLVGTAVTAADERVFHAMATRRVAGGTQGAFLVRYADQVANLCNDVVGDVSSAISGAIGAGLALLIAGGTGESLLEEIIITSLIAGLTVGGKALGKSFAIRNANQVIGFVARILDRLHIDLSIGREHKGNHS